MSLLNELLELTEDWGSSDWYPIIQALKKATEAGEDLDQEAENQAEFYYQDMGYDSAEDAKHRILAKWELVKKYHLKDGK